MPWPSLQNNQHHQTNCNKTHDSPPVHPPLCAVAFACGTLPDVLLSLQLSPARQAALFLPRLGSLSLAVPATSELRMCCHTPADATQAAYYGPGEPYLRWVLLGNSAQLLQSRAGLRWTLVVATPCRPLRACCLVVPPKGPSPFPCPRFPTLCSTQREAATTCSNPLAPAHTASRLSVLSGAGGSAVQVGRDWG